MNVTLHVLGVHKQECTDGQLALQDVLFGFLSPQNDKLL